MKCIDLKLSISSIRRPLAVIDSFKLYPGRINFLFGESGIGKTLISKALYGLLDPEELFITINNEPYQTFLQTGSVHDLQLNSFFVFQEPSSHFNPLLRLKKQLNEGTLKSAVNDRELVRSLWGNDRKFLQELMTVYPKPYRPSGGEKQRLFLTMAFKKISLLKDAKRSLFVFDEPTGSLDDDHRNKVLDLLFKYYRKTKFTILFITHDYSLISQIYHQHNDLLEHTDFLELRRTEGSTVIQERFSAETYLDWLGSLKPAETPAKKAGRVLELQSGLRAIGREFRFFADKGCKEETSLNISAGEMVYLKAPSGGGKTTIAKIILGLIKAENLQLELCGQKIDAAVNLKYWQKNLWGKKTAMVFQHADESLDRQASVYQAFKGLPLKGRDSRADIAALLQTLFEEKISDSFLDKKVSYLSGGQKQRLNILRALCLDVQFLVLDEPLNGLDFESIDRVLGILEKKRSQGCGMLLISHNEEILGKLVNAEQVVYLKTEQS